MQNQKFKKSFVTFQNSRELFTQLLKFNKCFMHFSQVLKLYMYVHSSSSRPENKTASSMSEYNYKTLIDFLPWDLIHVGGSFTF